MKSNPESYLFPGTNINFFHMTALVVNGKRIKKFSRFITCVSKGKSVHEMEICFLKDESGSEMEEIKFTTNEMKKYVAINSLRNFWGVTIVKKDSNVEMDILMADVENNFRKNIVKWRRISLCPTPKDFNSLLTDENFRTATKENYEFSVHLELYLYEVNETMWRQRHEFVRRAGKVDYVIYVFLTMHKCWNSECAGFSYKKCTGCMKARYCDAKCQKEDRKKHQNVCQSLSIENKLETWVINKVEELIKTNAKPKPPKQLKSLNETIQTRRWNFFVNWLREKEKNNHEQQLWAILFQMAKMDPQIVHHIVSCQTYLELLNTKKVQQNRIKEAMAEVD